MDFNFSKLIIKTKEVILMLNQLLNSSKPKILSYMTSEVLSLDQNFVFKKCLFAQFLGKKQSFLNNRKFYFGVVKFFHYVIGLRRPVLRALSNGKKYISKFSKLCFSRGSCGHIDLFQDKKQFLSFLNFVSKGFSGLGWVLFFSL